MIAVAAAATRAIEDAAGSVEIDPDALSTYVSAIAAVAAVPLEVSKSTAELGLAATTGLLRARSSRPAPVEVTSAAAATISGAIDVHLDSLLVDRSNSPSPSSPGDAGNATLNSTVSPDASVAAAKAGGNRGG